MQVFLALSGHPKANVRQVILGRTTVIGRSRDCGLQVASASVSRKHCEIRVSDDAVSVVDLGSSNGTFIGSDRLPAGEERPLPAGALLNVGGVRFLVTYSAASAEPHREAEVAGVAASPASGPATAAEEPMLDEPILADDVFVLDEPIALDESAAAAPVAAVEAASAESSEDEFVLDDEPDLAAMFGDESAPTQSAVTAGREPEPEIASDEPILGSDEDDAFAFLTEDDPAPVDSSREDSRLGA